MIQRKGFVYKFISDKNQVLYVGKTINMDARMKQHFSQKSHLHGSGLYEQIQRIEYMTCKNEFEALQKELMYINFYKPKFNTASKIKQLIDPPPSTDKWKVYKVIRPLTKEQEKTNRNIQKWLPIAMCLFFISIIIYLI